MAEIEKVSESDRMEQAGLERAVADIERVVLASPPGTRPLFNGFLLNAKARLGVLEKKIQDAEREERNHATNEAAIVELAQKETALNAKEKETYGGFLKKEFFTKGDFAKLDEFYTHSWDCLSESGKDQMSHRIWQGIRRDEYKFTELPKSVQEKETERAYNVLNRRSAASPDLSAIPDKDRTDFIRAYEAGKREEAGKVLERDSFKKSMFLNNESAARSHVAVDHGREAEKAAAAAKVAESRSQNTPQRAPEGAKSGAKNLSDLGLDDGIKLVDVEAQGTSAEIPNARAGGTSQRQSTPGG